MKEVSLSDFLSRVLASPISLVGAEIVSDSHIRRIFQVKNHARKISFTQYDADAPDLGWPCWNVKVLAMQYTVNRVVLKRTALDKPTLQIHIQEGDMHNAGSGALTTAAI